MKKYKEIKKRITWMIVIILGITHFLFTHIDLSENVRQVPSHDEVNLVITTPSLYKLLPGYLYEHSF